MLSETDATIEECVLTRHAVHTFQLLDIFSGTVIQARLLTQLLDDAKAVKSKLLPILRQSVFIGCISTDELSRVLAPLDPSVQLK